MLLRSCQFVLFIASLLMVTRPLTAQQSQQRLQAPAHPPTLRSMPLGPEGVEIVPAPAQGAQPLTIAGPQGASLTLEQVTEMAMGNNPVLLQARARIDSARGIAYQAGIPPNPRYDSNNPQVFAGNQSQYNVGFMQEFPVKGKLRLDRAAALRDLEQARMNFIRARFDLLTAVRQQFYRVLAQERRVDVLAELEQIAAKSRSAAQQREHAGEVAETDVLLLYTELLQARVGLDNARTQLDGARRALAATIGVPNFPIQDALGDLRANLPTFDEAAAREFVATQNAAVLAAQMQIAQNRILLQRARVEPYPNPYVGPAVAWGPSSSSSGGNGSQLWINMQMNIPVWNLNQGNIRAADANVRDAMASVGVLQNDLLRQTADTLAAYRIARERARRIGEEILPAAIRTQRLVRSSYDVGQKDISVLLQAQRALTQVNLDYVDALETAWYSAAALSGLLQLEQFP